MFIGFLFFLPSSLFISLDTYAPHAPLSKTRSHIKNDTPIWLLKMHICHSVRISWAYLQKCVAHLPEPMPRMVVSVCLFFFFFFFPFTFKTSLFFPYLCLLSTSDFLYIFQISLFSSTFQIFFNISYFYSSFTAPNFSTYFSSSDFLLPFSSLIRSSRESLYFCLLCYLFLFKSFSSIAFYIYFLSSSSPLSLPLYIYIYIYINTENIWWHIRCTGL